MTNISGLNIKYITNKKGEKIEVVLSIKSFNSLLEDLSDLAARADRFDENTVSHDNLVKDLKSDGLL